MLVYADAKRTADPRELLRALLDDAARLTSAAGRVRGEQLTALLLNAGELAQGLIDSEWQAATTDESSPLVATATDLVRTLATAFVADDEHMIELASRTLAGLALPERVSVSLPEGFAFYAVYPRSWAQLAEQHRGARTRVIGIRSIGLTLGAVVAAAAGSELFVSVRPSGHPFDRTLAIGPALARALLEHNDDVIYLIVDEGPGLSGSSFASIAKWLAARAVPLDRIVFMPSHAGAPGPHASDDVRHIWANVRKQVPAAPQVLERFAGSKDLSGGAWRHELYGQHPWPPANRQQERLKLLMQDCDLPRLAKFAGLGRYGAEKLALAQTLASSGWIPQPLELADGFLSSEWMTDALPLDHPAASFDRAQLLRRVGDYISFRASLPAPACPGAPVEALFRMLLANAEQALGAAGRARACAWERSLEQLGEGLQPCRTDNRMHRWEWITTSAGELLKCDALDHHAAHDLVGPQDPLWDLVGARHELALDDTEFSALAQRVARALGRNWTDTQIGFFSAAYLAFQCGATTMAAETAPEADALLLRREARRYARALMTTAPNVQ
jgi:hypothetical protein